MRLRAVAAFATIMLVGCTNTDTGEGGVDRDTLTQRQRDSIIGASSLPGARGVQRALEVTDSVNARRSALDTLQ